MLKYLSINYMYGGKDAVLFVSEGIISDEKYTLIYNANLVRPLYASFAIWQQYGRSAACNW